MVGPATITHWIAYLLVGSLLGTRIVRAEVSAACIASGKELVTNNPELLTKAPQAKCEIDVTESKECSFDFSTISAEYESLCTNAGGVFYEEDVKWDCKVTASGKTYEVTYNFQNYGTCLGGNCTDAEAMDFFDESVFPSFESSLASQGFICEVSGEGDGQSNATGTSASVRSVLNAAVVIFSLFSMAFSFM